MAIYTDLPWFESHYKAADKALILGLLKSLIDYETTTDAIECVMLERMASVFWDDTIHYQDIQAVDLQKHLDELSNYKRHDFLCLAIILCLCCSQHHQKRLKVLLDHLQDNFPAGERLQLALQAVLNSDLKTLRKPEILGEGFHNTMARENGLDTVGWFDYQKQMKSMKQGGEHLPLKEKFDFLNDAADNTLAGKLREQFKKSKLPLPGHSHGFSEFFVWHELSHVLSGNGTNWIGELGANSFTAGFSKRGKYSILIWGLLQFNLGTQLAVVATAATDKLNTAKKIERYLYSLRSGCETTLDLLTWGSEQMIADMNMDLEKVRTKYHINVYFTEKK